MTKEEAAHQPPTLIVVGSADPLRSEGAQFGRLLESSGVPCAVVEGKEQIHDTVLLKATRNGPTPQPLMKLAAIQLKKCCRRLQWWKQDL
jgi:acetyl esterase/lipase